MPKIKTDTFKMSVLVPILLTHCAFGLKFQSFSLIYTIDVDEGARPLSPNVVWNFRTDPNKETKPQIGTISPQVDSDKNVRFLAQVLVLWFETQNIKPGNMEGLNSGNLLSGVSKILDEMDTTEDRINQIAYFKPGEEKMWERILKVQHPIWVKDNDKLLKQNFSSEAEVNVDFPEQIPLINRGEMVTTIQKEIDMGVEHRLGAMRRLNPEMSEAEAQAYLDDVDAEKKENAEAFGVPKNPNADDDDETKDDETKDDENDDGDE